VQSSPFCNSYCLFTLLFLSKQTRHGKNIVSSCFFLFMCGRAKCLSHKQCVGSSARVDALCTSCSLQKYLEQWPAVLCEAGRSVLMLMKGSKIQRIELNTVHLYQHYSLFMANKLQYTWHGDYCECARPAQLPVWTEFRAPSLLEQHPWYVPHRDRAGYNNMSLPSHLCAVLKLKNLFFYFACLIKHRNSVNQQHDHWSKLNCMEVLQV